MKTILLIIYCVTIFVLINISFKADTFEYSNEIEGDKNTLSIYTEDDIVLTLTSDAGNEYIDKIYFVGDSTTYHFLKAGIQESHILVPDSLTLKLGADINTVTVRNNGLTIAKAIKEANCEIVIITIGVNGADNFTEVKYKSYYKKLIDEIRYESPESKIIIQSVFPVTKAYSDQNTGITNAGIDELNKWGKEIASDEGLGYLDTQSILKDDNGAQFEHYSEKDGVHMNSDAYSAIIEYIRTHAIE